MNAGEPLTLKQLLSNLYCEMHSFELDSFRLALKIRQDRNPFNNLSLALIWNAINDQNVLNPEIKDPNPGELNCNDPESLLKLLKTPNAIGLMNRLILERFNQIDQNSIEYQYIMGLFTPLEQSKIITLFE